MTISKKYWEAETPAEIKSDKNVIMVYAENGKIQVYPVVANTAHGIGKGATIDLFSMDVEQLRDFHEKVTIAVEVARTNKI